MEAPIHVSGISEDVLSGSRLLRQVFAEAPHQSAERGAIIVTGDDPEPPNLLIHRGVAYRSMTVPDGRRAIMDIFLPTDIAGLDHAIVGASGLEIVAASSISYRAISPAVLRKLLESRSIALCVFALLSEQRRRMDRHALMLARFDARERICTFVLGIYDRLRRAELITRPTFNLPLTQEQMADHLGVTMVHVSRMLRRLREERLVLIDRQVAIIMDLDRMRAIASGSNGGRAVCRTEVGGETHQRHA